MMDWMKVYNEADVVPFVKAIDKTHKQCYPDDIDMLKDAVSIPGTSMVYVLNKSLKMKQPGKLELFAPGQPCFHKCEECKATQNVVVKNARKYGMILCNVQKKQAVRIANDGHGWQPEDCFLPVSQVWKVSNPQRCKELCQSCRLQCEFSLLVLLWTSDALWQGTICICRSRPTYQYGGVMQPSHERYFIRIPPG